MQKINASFIVTQMPPINTNSVCAYCGDLCVIFDAWGTFDDWHTFLSQHKLKPTMIFATHGHPDHISAAPDIARYYDIPWYLSKSDNYLLGWGTEILRVYGLPPISKDVPPCAITHDMIEILPGITMEIISSPGHSRGGKIFYLPTFNLLISGDTIFQDSVGRCDLPGGDIEMLKHSIGYLYSMNLPDATVVVPGHGCTTTIGQLKQNNEYFRAW